MRRGIFVEIFHAVLVDEQIRLCIAGDSDDVLIVVLDPATNLFSINQLHDNWSAALRQPVDIFGLAESRLGRGLPAISPAGVFMRCSYCHAPKYSVFDVKIQE